MEQFLVTSRYPNMKILTFLNI